MRNSFRYASKRDWSAIAKDLKPVYTAASEPDALDLFVEFSEKWEKRHPAIIRLWTNAWAEFVPFLQFDRETRTIICTTNAIESINARIGRAVNARGHFPTEQAALKCIYLAVMNLARLANRSSSSCWPNALRQAPRTLTGSLSDQMALGGPASPVWRAISASYRVDRNQARKSSESVMSQYAPGRFAAGRGDTA